MDKEKDFSPEEMGMPLREDELLQGLINNNDPNS